jgi:hypothetical protein
MRAESPCLRGPAAVPEHHHARDRVAFLEISTPSPDTARFSRATMPEAYRLIRVLYRFIGAD